jgi:hypothetical protein
MLHLVELGRTYSPETIAVMTAAFDTVCRSAPMQVDDDVRRKLARTNPAVRRRGSARSGEPHRTAFNELAGNNRSTDEVAAR